MSPLLATACLCHQGGAGAINQGAGRGACTGVLHIQTGTLGVGRPLEAQLVSLPSVILATCVYKLVNHQF